MIKTQAQHALKKTRQRMMREMANNNVVPLRPFSGFMDMTVREILAEMEQMNVASSIFRRGGKAEPFAVMVVRGDNAQACVDAVNKITRPDDEV